jgi:branched-chain amino acid transport system substrate-binding protein
MIKKTTKTGSISRRRSLTAVAVSPFRINRLQAQEADIKIRPKNETYEEDQ